MGCREIIELIGRQVPPEQILGYHGTSCEALDVAKKSGKLTGLTVHMNMLNLPFKKGDLFLYPLSEQHRLSKMRIPAEKVFELVQEEARTIALRHALLKRLGLTIGEVDPYIRSITSILADDAAHGIFPFSRINHADDHKASDILELRDYAQGIAGAAGTSVHEVYKQLKQCLHLRGFVATILQTATSSYRILKGPDGIDSLIRTGTGLPLSYIGSLAPQGPYEQAYFLPK